MCTICSATTVFDPSRHLDENGQTIPSLANPAPSQSLIGTVQGSGQWGINEFDVYFAPNGYAVEGLGSPITSDGWLEYEIQQFEKAFALIEAVTNITFNVTNTDANAEMIVALDLDEIGSGTLGYFYGPAGGSYSGPPLSGGFNGTLWDYTPGGDLEIGGYSFPTIVHELLHGLGLGHPHDSFYGTTVMDGIPSNTDGFDDFGDYNFNQGVYTTMSYNTGNPGPGGIPGHLDGSGGLWGYEAGPMALDIAALQALYGANMSHATGNDTYTMPGANAPGTFWQSIWDAGGNDTITFSGSADATIDLRAATIEKEEGGLGWLSSADGVAGGFTIAHGVTIENASSGKGDDTITGNDVRNVIKSGGGSDTIMAGGGRDKVKSGGGGDSLYGEGGKDKLIGGGGNDMLMGGSGNDVLKGGKGGDTFVFDSDGGKDKIKDFGKGGDIIQIDSSLVSGVSNGQQIVDKYADDSGLDVKFSFGGGSVLTVKGVDDAASLIDDIFLI